MAINNHEKKITVTSETALSIDDIKHNSKARTIYDLAGRKLHEMTKPGIYIVNGKKHIKK